MPRFISQTRVLQEASIQEELDQEQQECRRKTGLQRRYTPPEERVDPNQNWFRYDANGKLIHCTNP